MPHQQLVYQLNQLNELLMVLSNDEYTRKATMLGRASIGQHIRHIIELVQGMVQGYPKGVINYDDRKRDVQIESDTYFAKEQVLELMDSVCLPDKELLLKQSHSSALIKTFYSREVLYNSEHAIHHMALIRVALREMNLDAVDKNFGVAPSTMEYRNVKLAVGSDQ